MNLGSKSKECLRSHIIVARAEVEGDKYMRSLGFLTYSRGVYTNFLHEKRKMRRLFSPAGRTVRTLRAVWRQKILVATRLRRPSCASITRCVKFTFTP